MRMHGKTAGHESRGMAYIFARFCRRSAPMVILGLGGLLTAGRAEAIEEPKYAVLTKEGGFEIRQYEPYLVAETIVEGDFSSVGNEGFRRLFKFISGENQPKKSNPMTAPVGQEASEKIEMAAPVQQQKEAGKWRISFVMPSGYNLETIPQPLDERIHIREAPREIVAAVRYS